jgi:hypothetical protein
MRQYRNRLHAQGERFMAEENFEKDDCLPAAWVSSLQGRKFLCVPEPLARIVLEPHAVGFKPKRKADEAHTRPGIIKTLGHEFVHTQGSVELEASPHTPHRKHYLGISFEEFRADVLSGATAYSDLQTHFWWLDMFKGTETGELIRRHPLGGAADKLGFYATC